MPAINLHADMNAPSDPYIYTNHNNSDMYIHMGRTGGDGVRDFKGLSRLFVKEEIASEGEVVVHGNLGVLIRVRSKGHRSEHGGGEGASEIFLARRENERGVARVGSGIELANVETFREGTAIYSLNERS